MSTTTERHVGSTIALVLAALILVAGIVIYLSLP